MALRTVNLEAGLPTLEEARRRLLAAIDTAQQDGVRVLKVVHGYGSSGAGGVLCTGIRRSLRLRVKEGKALRVVPGERFSSDALEARELLQRHPALRRDRDFNRANPGITILELAPG
ncbi:MAG: Smr/MutS family protein [Verrucomicrobiia bacterium]